MKSAARSRLFLLVCGAALTLLLGATPLRGEPPKAAGCVVRGTVHGLRAEEEARLELRRLAQATSGNRKTWDRPYSHTADAGDWDRWLSRGAAPGTPLATRALRGRAGAYRFQGLATGIYELRIVRNDAAPRSGIASLVAAGQHVERDLNVERGPLTLRVQVRTRAGAPFRGMLVAAQKARGLKAFPYLDGALEAEIDETGLVEMRGLFPGPCELSALLPGSLRVRSPVIDLPHEGVHTWIVDTERKLSGTLVRREDEKPVVGARVYAYLSGYPDVPFALAGGRSDDAGHFALPVGGPGTELLIIAPGRAPARLDLTDGSSLGTLRIAPSARITGWVRGPDGAPCADVTVEARPMSPLGVAQPTLTTRTDAGGRYTLDEVPPGEPRIFAFGEAWISSRFNEGSPGEFDPHARALGAGETLRLDLKAVPAARIHGRVLDARGKPVAGALIHAGEYRADTSTYVTTDAEGGFELRGLDPRTEYHLSVRASGQVRQRREAVPATLPGNGLEIRFPEPCFVTVDVVDETGIPVQGARVRVHQVSGAPGDTSYHYTPDVWTNARGEARAGPMARGKASVHVLAAGASDGQTRSLTLGTDTALRVRLMPAEDKDPPKVALRLVRGRIVAPAGVALDNVDLRRSEPGEVLLGAWENKGGTQMMVGPEGIFLARLQSNARFGFRARALHDGHVYWGEGSAAAGVTELEIHLKPAPWLAPTSLPLPLSFRIVDGEGRPVPTGRATGGVGATSACDGLRKSYGAGRLEIPDTRGAEGTPWYFRDAMDACGIWLPLGPALVDPTASKDTPIQVELPPEKFVHGHVTGPAGVDLQGIRVRAQPISEALSEIDEHHSSALVGIGGRFRLGGLGTGPHMLLLDVPPSFARAEPFLLATIPYEEDEVRIHVHRAVAPRVRVLDAQGNAIPKAEVRIEPANDDWWTFTDNVIIHGFYSGPGHASSYTDDDGWMSFTRLDPEKGYIVWISPPASHPELASLYLPAWHPQAEQVIQLRPRVSVHGIVQDDQGVPMADTNVWAWLPGDYDWRTTESDAEGRFTFEGMRPGLVSLLATEAPDPPYGPARRGILHTKTDAPGIILLVQP